MESQLLVRTKENLRDENSRTWLSWPSRGFFLSVFVFKKVNRVAQNFSD